MAKCAALKVELKDAVNELAGRSTERQIQASGRGIVKLAGNCLFLKKKKSKRCGSGESNCFVFFGWWVVENEKCFSIRLNFLL